MRKIRTCAASRMNSGGSACKIDWGKVKGAFLVEHGVKLPAELTAQILEELCHADRPDRIYPIFPIFEGAKNGGEPQINAVGYGPSQYNGLNAQTDTFTLARFDEALNARLLQCAGKEWDAYYWDSNMMLHGYNDGTDILAGIPMSTVYPTVTPYSTSGAKSSMTVSFCRMDAEDSLINFDYVKLDFNPANFIRGGLVDVELVTTTANKYKILEKIGAYDRTPEFGQLIADKAAEVLNNVTTATYADGELTITPKDSGVPSLKAPSVLFENNIKYIEQV